uniref:F-box domain-containing protein n=2 Tax=Caenorhabditis tropicalis TaxID=1561998 RepID=A0A1I7T3Q2_9PELO
MNSMFSCFNIRSKRRKEEEIEQPKEEKPSTNSPSPEVPIEEEQSTNFRLLELPDVARIEVIQSMDALEQIKLALSSKRIESYMKVVNNKKLGQCHVRYTGLEAFIATPSIPLLYYGSQEEKLKMPAITSRDLQPWLNEGSTLLENTVNLFERYRKAFPYESLALLIYPNLSVNVKAILETPLYKDCDFVVFKEGKISTEDLNAGLEGTHDGRSIDLKLQEMPLDFNQKNV